MATRLSGRLYPRLIAYFLVMVVFASIILAGAAGWFTFKSEEALRMRIADNMEAVTNRLASDVLSLYDLCGLVAGNVLIQENFRPYDELTVAQKYYSNAIIDLLWQSRLQYSGLVDSVFLFADGERVLYSANEKGMAHSQAFFSRLMCFESMSQAHWLALLENRQIGYQVLPPDSYITPQLSGSHPVVPVTYTNSNHGRANVLVMNLSLDKIRSLYEATSVLRQTRFAIYGNDGQLLSGDAEGLPVYQEARDSQPVLESDAGYVYSSHHLILGITVLSLTPRSALMQMTDYYRFLVVAMPLVFAIFGVTMAVVLSRKMYEPFRVVHESIRPYTDNLSYRSELEAIKTSIANLANDRQTYLTQSREHLTRYVSQTLFSLLSGHPLDDEAYFAQLMAEEYGFASPACRVVDFLLDMEDPSTYLTIHEAMKRFSQVIQRVFEGHSPFVRVRFRENMYVLVLSAQEEGIEAVQALCTQVAERIAQSPGLNAVVRFGVGSLARQFAELPESFDAANSSVFALASPEDLADSAWEEDFRYDRREIVSAVSACDLNLVKAICAKILESAKRHGIPYPMAVAVLNDIFQTAASLKQKLNPDSPRPLETVDPLSVLLLSPRINTSSLVSAMLPYIPRPSQSRPEDGMKKIALRVKAYIDVNYPQEFSLDILADKLGLSAKYLSRVFKQVMEVNLSDYLAFVRVERIKELLMSPLTMDRISDQVGITNRTTFTRTFRKLEGMTPSEWRRIHQHRVAASDAEKDQDV